VEKSDRDFSTVSHSAWKTLRQKRCGFPTVTKAESENKTGVKTIKTVYHVPEHVFTIFPLYTIQEGIPMFILGGADRGDGGPLRGRFCSVGNGRLLTTDAKLWSAAAGRPFAIRALQLPVRDEFFAGSTCKAVA
jgi:hypothetical protein